MPFLRVRFTVRRLMVAVAVVAIVLGAIYVLASRRARFLAIAPEHWDAIQEPFLKYYDVYLTPEQARQWALTRDGWHMAMSVRYGYAADHPWLPVAPDPPEPE
jgi:hypothetical protein